VYPKPYENEVKTFEISGFEFISETPVNYEITLSTDQALTLWQMTPYYYRSPKQGIEALSNISKIKTQVSFHILIFKLNKDR
jgi:23S rRNA (guanine745-N1)-methyltransferase